MRRSRLLGLRLNFYVASILFIAGIAWFVRIQRVRASPTTIRRGGALLATGGLLALTGCGQASHTNGKHATASSLAVSPALVAQARLPSRQSDI